jgi:hypothetical protein
MQFPVDMSQGEALTGYNLLGGSNADAGGFFVKVVWDLSADCRTLDAIAFYRFNDVTDPNWQYESDKWKDIASQILTSPIPHVKPTPFVTRITFRENVKVVDTGGFELRAHFRTMEPSRE